MSSLEGRPLRLRRNDTFEGGCTAEKGQSGASLAAYAVVLESDVLFKSRQREYGS